MTNKLPHAIKLQAVELHVQGHKQKDITDTLGICVPSITKAKYKMSLYGDIEGGAKKRGPKSKMDPGIQDVMLLFSPNNSRHFLQ